MSSLSQEQRKISRFLFQRKGLGVQSLYSLKKSRLVPQVSHYFEIHGFFVLSCCALQEKSLLGMSEALGRNNWLLMGMRFSEGPTSMCNVSSLLNFKKC